MRRIETEVLVIGGGAAGTGVLRDLAMRGFDALLVEARDYSHGTTGRYHGLLHSGGRYVVSDPKTAAECIRENRILRRIMPHCLEDTGGFFVLTPWDEEAYVEPFLAGCRRAGIPVEEISIRQMLRQEPRLNPAIQRCFWVPDASADSFLAAEANVASAREYGAHTLTYHPVLELLRDGRRVAGARCHDLVRGEEVQVHADLVVNAAGAWAGKVAAGAGVSVRILPGKGAMLAVNHRPVNTVVNRCKHPSDGDILVPIHTVAVIGTTDVPVPDPDRIAIEAWEIRLLLEEGEKLLPGFSRLRALRAWAGARPLFQEGEAAGSRQVSRAFALLDHEARDGLAGLVTITGGKWTTYRLMAEATVDLVCEKLHVQRPCRTHLEPLPGGERLHYLGARLEKVEETGDYGSPLCECELVTRADIVDAIVNGQACTLDDLRRDTRLGMGPCQGGFCTLRAAGVWHSLRQLPIEEVNGLLRDFLQERWKGLLPILWGQQLRQERLDELIYLSSLNLDHLPAFQASPLAAEGHGVPATTGAAGSPAGPASLQTGEGSSSGPARLPVYPSNPPTARPPEEGEGRSRQVLVIGAGISGLAAAWQAAAAGLRPTVIARGWGAACWHAGCVDVLGYDPAAGDAPLEAPLVALRRLVEENPEHPYARTGLGTLAEALQAFQALCREAGYSMLGSLERNWLLPSACGAIRPTCLAPETMTAGDLSRRDPILVAGFEPLADFYPRLVAANLARQGIPAEGIDLHLPSLRGRRFVFPVNLARAFESEAFRKELAEALAPRLGSCARVGFPAVLGMRNAPAICRDLESRLGRPVFEIPGLPPSIPGMRLQELLVAAIERLGGAVFNGMLAQAFEAQGRRVQRVWSEAAARPKAHRAEWFVLATGGLLGGGIEADAQGRVRETLFDLPLSAPASIQDWFQPAFLDPRGHPVFRAGVRVDESFHPAKDGGAIPFENLFAAGTGLAGGDYLRERSFDGVALATGFAVGRRIAATYRFESAAGG